MNSTFRKQPTWLITSVLLAVCVLSNRSDAQSAEPLPRKPMMGAQFLVATEDERKAARVSASEALKVGRVGPGTTADAVGLKADDIVLSIDGKQLENVAALTRHIATRKSGEAVNVSVTRGGSNVELKGKWIERAREANNETYKVEYGHVASQRGRMRTVVTTPAKADKSAQSGKHPALLFIQGVTLGSVDFALAGADNNSYARIVRSFAEGGYVTMRVDKPGVGDSEGGPGAAVRFMQELDAYRQAL